jgi:hypothetical protein
MMVRKLFADISEKAVRKLTASLSLTEFTKSCLYSAIFRVETNKKGCRCVCNLSLANEFAKSAKLYLRPAFSYVINKRGCDRSHNLSLII